MRAPAPARPLLLRLVMVPLSCDGAAKGMAWFIVEVDDPVLYVCHGGVGAAC